MPKYAHFLTLKHPFTAARAADIFIKEIVSSVAFQDPSSQTMTKYFWVIFGQNYFAYGELSFTRAQPITGKLMDRMKWLCFTYDKPKSWSSWIPWAEYWYNTTFHSSTKTTPFWAVYGRDPPPLIRYGSQSTAVQSVEQQLQARDNVLDELKSHLHHAQERMKEAADRQRRDIHFEVGIGVHQASSLLSQFPSQETQWETGTQIIWPVWCRKAYRIDGLLLETATNRGYSSCVSYLSNEKRL